MHTIPKLQTIDHAHLYVPDREQAAQWYQNKLGFTPVDALAVWADDPGGPLVLCHSGSTINLALFQSDQPKPSTHLAFGCTAVEFIHWKTYLENLDLLLRCTDHALSWSLYFNDPYKNMHEITTYEHATVSLLLDGKRS